MPDDCSWIWCESSEIPCALQQGRSWSIHRRVSQQHMFDAGRGGRDRLPLTEVRLDTHGAAVGCLTRDDPAQLLGVYLNGAEDCLDGTRQCASCFPYSY